MEEYQIAFGVDDNYVKYAGVMMTSIILNQPGQAICFHLVCDGLNPEDQDKLEEFTKLYRNTKIMIYEAKELLKAVPDLPQGAPDRLNKTVFLRILLPNYLPSTVKKILYFDADMLCVGSLAKLWQQELAKNFLAALLDPAHVLRSKKLGLSHKRYFNAGAMLIDVDGWRQAQMTERVLASYRENVARFPMLEQDTLNYLVDGQFTEFPATSICTMDAFNHLQIKPQADNVVWHFVNAGKPWVKNCDPEIEKIYWSYVHRSLWFDMTAIEPRDVKTAFLAGKNAEKKGEYKAAAHYLGLVASRLMEYYLQQMERD